MRYVFSLKKILDGNGLSISITGLLIVFFALSSIAIFIFLFSKILKRFNKIFPEKAEEVIIVSEPSVERKEIVAAIGYALLKSKSN